jgi:hypothetical protein
MELLTGHTSPETAYLVADYPYGFTLRCQIRFWLEYKPKFGYRLMSQTSNPKKPGLVWNKPKGSTYRTLGVMFLDEQAHVSWAGLDAYRALDEVQRYGATYGAAFDAKQQAIYTALLAWSTAYEARKQAQASA